MSDEPSIPTLEEVATYAETGRITGYRRQLPRHTQEAQARGERVLAGDTGYDLTTFSTSRFVDLSGSEPTFRDRPVFEGRFDRPILPAGEEATLTGVPACTVSFAGPVTGEHEHAGGDLEIGFTMPGTYTISFEAFPALPVALTLTVTD